MTVFEGEKGLVSIGIVTWNSAKDLPACIESLREQSYPDVEYIIVDNGSRDNSLSMMQVQLPRARLIRNACNRGYCRAHNQAIAAARGEFYLALNPDVTLQPGFITTLVATLESHPESGSAVGKILLRHDNRSRNPRIDGAGLLIDRRRHQYLRGHRQVDRGQYDGPGEVFGADGAAPLHRRAMLEDVKVFGQYFDEQFFAYMEDVDLAWRARLLGWSCRYEPGAMAYHDRSFMPGRRVRMPKILRRIAIKNRYLTLIKNEAPECWRRDWWRILAYDVAILGYLILFEQTSLGAFPMLKRQWERAQAWRREIWRRVKADPAERLRWFG